MPIPLEAVLFAFLIAMALLVATLRDLFAAAMLSGIFSLVSAGLFTLMDAVDVAFTEAAVGAGVSTILLLATLSLTGATERAPRRGRLLPLTVVVVTGIALAYGTLDMPRYGDPAAPIHHHVAPRYLTESGQEIGIPNVVTSVLASYRGFDTLGELVVIFTAALGVLLVLARSPSRPEPADRGGTGEARRRSRMREKDVLRVVAKLILPFVLLFGLYVQFHGDFGPGGGFQAGVIFAAGFIVYGMIFSADELARVLSPARVELAVVAGVLLFGGVGVVALLLGGNFLDYSTFDPEHPAHGQHLGILLVELGVGISVASAILVVYYRFTGAGQA